MTVPNANAPATPAAAPAPAPTPAPEGAAPKGAPSRREALAARLADADTSSSSADAPLEQPAAPTFTPDPPPAPPAEPAPSKLQAVRAKLQQQREARQTQQAQEAQTKQVTDLQQELDRTKQQPSMDQFLAEYARDPAATLRKYKIDPRKHVELLSRDMISPGTAAAAAAAADSNSAVETLQERLDRLEAERTAEKQAQQADAYNRDYVRVTSDTTKFPLQSKLPDQRRLDLAISVWDQLSRQGHAYDRDLVAETVEALLEEDQKYLAPPPPPKAAPAPSSSTRPTPTPQAVAKQPPKTITPDLSGSSAGAVRRKNKAERRAALADKLQPVEG